MSNKSNKTIRYDFILYVDYDGKTKSAVVPREVRRRVVA